MSDVRVQDKGTGTKDKDDPESPTKALTGPDPEGPTPIRTDSNTVTVSVGYRIGYKYVRRWLRVWGTGYDDDDGSWGYGLDKLYGLTGTVCWYGYGSIRSFLVRLACLVDKP